MTEIILFRADDCAALAEIERLKQEKEEAQREYFLKQQELLTQIRDALNNK